MLSAFFPNARLSSLPPVALTIAGSDSSGGAGIQADLRTFGALGVYGTCALTAATAQNTCGVSFIEPVSKEMLRKQLRAVLSDFPVRAAKTGMLYSVENIEIVTQIWTELQEDGSYLPLVIDPVLKASTGALLSSETSSFLYALRGLFSHATLLTPNLPEARALLASNPEILHLPQMKDAARKLHDAFGVPILLKGGHLYEGRPSKSDQIQDVFYDGKNLEVLSHPRIHTKNTHGTGCTLSAAITACLARGKPLRKAVESGRDYLQGALQSSLDLGKGSGPLGVPLLSI